MLRHSRWTDRFFYSVLDRIEDRISDALETFDARVRAIRRKALFSVYAVFFFLFGSTLLGIGLVFFLSDSLNMGRAFSFIIVALAALIGAFIFNEKGGVK